MSLERAGPSSRYVDYTQSSHSGYRPSSVSSYEYPPERPPRRERDRRERSRSRDSSRERYPGGRGVGREGGRGWLWKNVVIFDSNHVLVVFVWLFCFIFDLYYILVVAIVITRTYTHPHTHKNKRKHSQLSQQITPPPHFPLRRCTTTRASRRTEPRATEPRASSPSGTRP